MPLRGGQLLALAAAAFAQPPVLFSFTGSFQVLRADPAPTGGGGVVGQQYSFAVGEHGVDNGVTFFTRRMDIATPAPISSLWLGYKSNGTTVQASFWSAGPGNASAVSCAPQFAIPLPWEATDFDWIIDGTAGTLSYVGKETLSTVFTGGANITAQHWRTAAGCRDVWLTALTNGLGPLGPSRTSYLQPVQYQVAAAGSGQGCTTGIRLYQYNTSTFLEPPADSQSNPLFQLPAPCFLGASGSPGSGGGGGGGPTVGVLWLIVGVLGAFAVALITGIVVGRHLQLAHRRVIEVANIQSSFKPLMDGI